MLRKMNRTVPLLVPVVIAFATFSAGPAGARITVPKAKVTKAKIAATADTDALPFASTSFWRAPLAADTPVDAASPTLVGRLVDQVNRFGSWINTTAYTAPVYEVPADQPLVRITLDSNDPKLQAAFAAVPLPATARGSNGTDSSGIVWQRSTDTLWEFWQLRKAADGWHARWGGRITGVSLSNGVYPAPYGTAASGLSMLGGLMRTTEVKARTIDHALSIAVPEVTAKTFRWPATRTDGKVVNGGIPLGTRFRLDPRVDVTKLGMPAAGVAMARAAQRYGLVVTDTAGAVCFAGEDPAPFGLDPWPAIFSNLPPWETLRNFPWSRLQVIATP